MDLLRRIERHMRRNGMSATRLGREAVGDPRFVADLRAGRAPRAQTAERVERWLAKGGRTWRR